MKKALSLVLCIAISLALLGGTALASDTPSSWAVTEVNAAITANLVPQYLQSNYTQPITRAEFCALVVVLFEKVRGINIDDASVCQLKNPAFGPEKVQHSPHR